MKELGVVALLAMVAGCGLESLPADARETAARIAHASRLEERKPGNPLRRVEDEATASRDRQQCSRWVYDANNIASDLGAMKPANQQEWGNRCYQYACSYQGKIDAEGKKQSIVVNAGGWISLADENQGTRYFVSSERLPDFLAACDCCE